MAQWLNGGELANEEDLMVIMVAKTDDSGIASYETVEPEELKQWQSDKGLSNCTNCVFLDGDEETIGWEVFDRFKNANSNLNITAGIPMVLDKKMVIREFSGTYEWDEYPLSSIQQLLDE